MWNDYKYVLGFVGVLMSIGTVVVVLETKLMVQFSLKSVKDSVGIIAPAKGSWDMLLFLSQ